MGMIWLARTDDTLPDFISPNQRRASSINLEGAGTSGYLGIGSIIVEATFDQIKQESSPLIECSLAGGTEGHFSLWVDSFGSAKAQIKSKDTVRSIKLAKKSTETHAHLRVTFSWNALGQTALLSVENPLRGTLDQAECKAALPIPMQIINELLSHNTRAKIALNVSFLGISDQIEPVGIAPTIAKGSPVRTPKGPVPIENLKAGDLVTTTYNGPQSIRWICERTMPTMGLSQPLRLRAPYFGLTRDILVAPEQRLLFENAEIEYLFGKDSALAEVRHLANSVTVLPEPAKTNGIRLFQLLFDQHEIISVAGCLMESLFVGQIADSPEILSSTLLNGLSLETVPRHENLARPLLHSHEAAALHFVA